MNNIIDIEIELLLEAVHKIYNYDFSNYSRAHVKRRILYFMNYHSLKSVSQVQHFVVHDKNNFEKLLNELSIKVTEMFRNPSFFISLRNNVLPVLKTYPFPKIWIAGCATGEEVYSTAILLIEEGLYDRTQIIATDFNSNALKIAENGIYPIYKIKQYTQNYQKSGGKNSFSNYYSASNNFVQLDKNLKKNINFVKHNLDKDNIFTKANLIICRNVMIYFNKTLQNKAVNLFTRSLNTGGFLALGSKESLLFSNDRNKYKEIDSENKIFKLINFYR
jgi:chemotaxis protein methyltransferase CheR